MEDDDDEPDDFTMRLERLAAMYRRGDLSAAEFEAAKSWLAPRVAREDIDG